MNLRLEEQYQSSLASLHLDDQYKLFIDGKWVDSACGKTFTTTNPATGDPLAVCANACSDDVDRAVDAAWDAFHSWKKTSPQDRAAMLLAIADLIDANAEHLAMVETMDNGKPIRETSAIDVPLSSDHFRYFASAIRTEEGQATMINDTTMSLVLREPIGVVGQIIPWNFPLLMAAWKLSPALAAGNCVVIKPSTETPLSLLELAKLLAQVLPAGVVNVLTGKGPPPAMPCSATPAFQAGLHRLDRGRLHRGRTRGQAAHPLHPGTRRQVGQHLLPGRALGKSPGRPATRHPVQPGPGVLRRFPGVHPRGHLRRLPGRGGQSLQKDQVGLPWDPETQMGAQVNTRQLEKILACVELGRSEGAKVAVGGERVTEGDLAKGAFMRPTLLADVNNSMRVAQEEIFGPVACCIKFKDVDEVIDMANDSEYGLAGAVWTRDINRAIRVSRAIETGRMWINTYNVLPAHAPFGGYKKSGIGRENHHMMLDHYTQHKNIIISLSEDKLGLY
jgi:acyl-CoA reductase-like NAD-dependent aldehyde dehydrogenase